MDGDEGEARGAFRQRDGGALRASGVVHAAAASTAYAWMPLLTLGVFLGVQWWAAWYPGAEPGGGGYVAQRIFSAQTERDGVLATLSFQVAHYALRPWPWIITGLATVILYPNGIGPNHDHEAAYVQAFVDLLPTPWRGFMMAGFAAAYMSTVATQLNWGASYLVNDCLSPIHEQDREREALRRRCRAGRRSCCSSLSTLVTWQLSSVEGRVEVPAGDRRGNGPRPDPPLVLVADQRVVGDQRDARVVRDLGDLLQDRARRAGTRPATRATDSVIMLDHGRARARSSGSRSRT